MKNKAGNFVEPTLENASAAADGAEVADDLTFSAIWADGDSAYPITAQTWIIAYKVQTDAAKADALKAFLTYILTDGQTLAAEVNYAPLPKGLDDQGAGPARRLRDRLINPPAVSPGWDDLFEVAPLGQYCADR